MTAATPDIGLSPEVRHTLASLRRKIRRYVWIEGLASTAAAAGIAFWAILAVDWLLEPAVVFRGLMLAGGALFVAAVFYRLILRRVFVPLTDRNMAMVLERRFPEFDESLLTAVELALHSPERDHYNPDMFARTRRVAERYIHDVRLGRVFNPIPLRRGITVAVLLAASIVAFALLSADFFNAWVQRNLLFADRLYPRRTRLFVEGFEDGVVKVARGADYTVVAKASRVPTADLPRPLVPEKLDLRFRTDSGNRGRVTMTTEPVSSDVDPNEVPFQEYSHKFEGILVSRSLEIYGGDARIPAQRGESLEIQVVDNPTIEKLYVDCQYPEYTLRSPGTREATGVMPLPRGTRVTIRAAQTNKDLVSVEVRHITDEEAGTYWSVAVDPLADGDPRSFQYPFGELREDALLEFVLTDADGITSAEPVRLVLRTVVDQPPQLAVALRGIDRAITPNARIPLSGRVTDDYGMDRLWFTVVLENQVVGLAERFAWAADAGIAAAAPPQAGLLTLAGLRDAIDRTAGPAADVFTWAEPKDLTPGEADSYPPTDLDMEKVGGAGAESGGAALDMQSLADVLDVKAGQRLLLTLSARDRFRLYGQGPNVASSEQWPLEIVTPQRLRAMLQSRELFLRQQFEKIIDEVSQSRTMLAGIRYTAPGPGEDESLLPPAVEGEPGGEDQTPLTPEQIEQELQNRREVRFSRAQQNSNRHAHELLALADAFEAIRDQVINNRLDNNTGPYSKRLREGIADPLRDIAENMFPELQKRLDTLEAVLNNPEAGTEALTDAIVQVDNILEQMEGVLQRMEELETFNRLVEELGELIEDLGKLREETDKLRKESIRSDLL